MGRSSAAGLGKFPSREKYQAACRAAPCGEPRICAVAKSAAHKTFCRAEARITPWLKKPRGEKAQRGKSWQKDRRHSVFLKKF